MVTEVAVTLFDKMLKLYYFVVCALGFHMWLLFCHCLVLILCDNSTSQAKYPCFPWKTTSCTKRLNWFDYFVSRPLVMHVYVPGEHVCYLILLNKWTL